MGSSKKHKKHKREKYEGEKPPALKLILKVGNSSTPEHSDSPGPHIQTSSYTITPDDESLQSSSSFHKKSKKKKKKKERDYDKHDRKKKHHHKDKKKHNTIDDSSQDNISFVEDSSTDVPLQMKDDFSKQLCDPQSPDSSVNREARLCVQLLRQKQNRTPLQRVLEYLQQQLEKKDVKQVFAWPVTDQIAPGYSQTITQPMDFSTMRQKIDDNAYRNLNSYISDLQLMCNNAMIYNRPDTMYYKAAKRLLHAGLKFLSSDKLRQLAVTFPIITQVPAEQLGFQIGTGNLVEEYESNSVDNSDEIFKKEIAGELSPKRKHCNFSSENKFEAIPDDLSAEEILEIAQKAARRAAEKLATKRQKTNIGFLQHKSDGSTSISFFISDDNDAEIVQEQLVSLGQLSGKLSHGSGQLQGLKDERRNASKTVKQLNYGAFGSYAPSYDSTFANLSKEESDLIYETYGDENATIYAESILNFAKDCDYTLTMVDNLLDLLTGGEHRKVKVVIDEHRKFQEEEERVRELMETKNVINCRQISSPKSELSNLKIEVDQLKTLSEYGIDTSFLNEFEGVKENNGVQEKIEHSTTLLEKLQQVQSDRINSAPQPPPQPPPPPRPQHLRQTMQQTSDNDLHLTEKITESLSELAKQVPPGGIIPAPAIRKPMNIVPETTLVSTATNTVMPITNSVEGVVTLEEDSSGEEEGCVGVGVDFESELREFLESDTALSGFPLHDDKTIEEMLSES